MLVGPVVKLGLITRPPMNAIATKYTMWGREVLSRHVAAGPKRPHVAIKEGDSRRRPMGSRTGCQ